MAHGLQQIEEIPRAVGHGRAREQVDRPGLAAAVAQPGESQHVLGAGRVVLDVVGLVDGQAGPIDGVERLVVPAEEVVVDDRPAGVRSGAILAAHDVDIGVGLDEVDLACPGQLHAGRADDEVRARRAGPRAGR